MEPSRVVDVDLQCKCRAYGVPEVSCTWYRYPDQVVLVPEVPGTVKI